MTTALPGWREWLFSARSFAAAMLALYLALWLDLPRPYWAVGTVYITVQVSTGALRAKALARFLGTLAGGAFAVAAVPNLVDAPPLLVLALALWVAGCTMGSLYDPTPRSYAFRLAGYTAALIAFPAVADPGAIFDTALSRIEEIGLGILCVTLVDEVFPRPATPLLLARLEAWIGGMARFGADALAGRLDEARFLAERRRVARDGAALTTLFEETRYETADPGVIGPAAGQPRMRKPGIAQAAAGQPEPHGHGTSVQEITGPGTLGRETGGRGAGLHWVRRLRGRARGVPAMISAVADRAQALRRSDPAAHAALAPLLDEAAAWLADTADPARRTAARQATARLLARLQAAEEQAAAAAGDAATDADAGGWPALLREGLLARLRELVESWDHALALEPRAEGLAGALAREAPEAPAPVTSGHTDPLLVALTGLSVVLAILACDVAWVLTAWPEGATATMMAAVATAMFAQLDDPAPAIASFLGWTVVAVGLAGLYLFAVLPAIDGFSLLVAALGVVYLPLGALHAMPGGLGIALPILVNTVALIALQEMYAADFAGYVNGALALLAGFASGLVTTRLVRAFGIDWRLRRLVRADRHDLAALIEGRRGDLRRTVAVMLDRFEFLAGRIGSADADTLEVSELAELRAAVNVVRLREVAARLPPSLRPKVAAALAALAALARGRASAEQALARLDAALTAAMPERDPAARAAALALSGIRRALFPAAPSPLPAPPLRAAA